MADHEHVNRIVDDGAVASENGAPPQTGNDKTAYCTKCHKRHRTSNWPDGHPMGTKDAETITGAGSAEELGEQTRAQVDKKKAGSRPKAADRKLDVEELQRRRISAVRLGKKIAAAPYSIAVIVTADPEWRTALAQDEIDSTAEDFADFCEAWGIQAAGKIASAAILATGMAVTGGKVYARVKAKEAANEFRAS